MSVLVAGEAIACDSWVYQSTQDGLVYRVRVPEDMDYVIGRLALSVQRGDEIVANELIDVRHDWLREVACMRDDDPSVREGW